MPLERCCETIKPSRLWNIRLTLRQGASRRNRRPRLRPNTGTSAFPQFLAQPLFLSRGSPPPPTLPGPPKDGLSKMRPRRVRLFLLLLLSLLPWPSRTGIQLVSHTGSLTCLSPTLFPPQCGVLPGPVEAEADAHDPLLRLYKVRPRIHGPQSRSRTAAGDVAPATLSPPPSLLRSVLAGAGETVDGSLVSAVVVAHSPLPVPTYLYDRCCITNAIQVL